MDVGDGRQPLGAEQIRVERAVDVSLPLARQPAEVLPGDPAARAEGVLDRGKRLGEGDAGAGHRRQVGQGVPVDQHLGVPGGKPVAALLGSGLDIVHLENAGDRLLLEPLARVALVGSGRLGELARRHVTLVDQRPVVPESISEVDGEELVRAERGSEEALGEGIPLRVVGLRRHGSSSSV